MKEYDVCLFLSSLTESTPKLLELLVSLVGDEYDEVASLSQATFERNLTTSFRWGSKAVSGIAGR